MIGKRIHPQHFNVGFEEAVVGEEQGEHKDVVRRIRAVYDYADASPAEIDGLLCEVALCCVCLSLNTHGQGDVDAKIGAAVSAGRRRTRFVWRISWHRGTSIAKSAEVTAGNLIM